jgi:hypothetical protein
MLGPLVIDIHIDGTVEHMVALQLCSASKSQTP